MSEPTPSLHSGIVTRHATCGTIADALDYAARGPAGLNFYPGRSTLVEALPDRALRQQAIALARRMLGAAPQPGCWVGPIAESDGDFPRAFVACLYASIVPVLWYRRGVRRRVRGPSWHSRWVSVHGPGLGAREGLPPVVRAKSTT